MDKQSPHTAGSARTLDERPPERTTLEGLQSLVNAPELRERLDAILDEIDVVTGWTVADQAELDVLVWALTEGWHRHRPTCDLDPCPHLRRAITEVLDWREARLLLSRAQAFRIEERVHASWERETTTRSATT